MIRSVMATRERWIAGGRLAGGGEVALRVRDGRIVELAARAPRDAARLELEGRWLVPFALDTHVHLAFAAGLGARHADDPPAARVRLSALLGELFQAGVAGAIDLGAPLALVPLMRSLATPPRLIWPPNDIGGTQHKLDGTQHNIVGTPHIPGAAPACSLAWSGPLLCAPRGYPTESWGRDGYGLVVATPEAARAAVRELHQGGARFIKLSFDGRFPVLAPAVARAAVLEAEGLGLLTVAHALDVAAVTSALAAQVAVLAHAPLEPLPASLVSAAGAARLAVLSTLHAYGATAAARDNLARLAAAGCRPIYGTDLGNEGTAPGISAPELRALQECGFSSAQILDICTREAADFFGDPSLGRLQPGAQANLLVLEEDPLRDPTALCRPAQRLLAGEPQLAS